jgi:hypothetical protein
MHLVDCIDAAGFAFAIHKTNKATFTSAMIMVSGDIQVQVMSK